MKKIIFNWLAALLTIIMCIGLEACKDDDNDSKQTTNSIIGTWRYDSSAGYVLITFREDGTGVEYEYDPYDGMGEGMLDADSFTWAQNKNTIIIKFDDGYTEIFENVSISSNTLKWVDPDGYTIIYKRQQ